MPLGAALLLGTLGTAAWAQDVRTESVDGTLPTVEVREKAPEPEGKDTIHATTARIGKGKQALKDIPQSVTVVTEKLMDDRRIATVKEALQETAGVTFQAGETGEEDIRLRGFSLAASGDLFLDGMRDPAFYDRDTFNLDQVEVLRGSASMLFGRGSTGGAVNQVSKTPRPLDDYEVSATVGNGQRLRLTGDFNIQTGDTQALRINALSDHTASNGIGAREERKGLAASYAWGIGMRDEFLVSLYPSTTRTASITACPTSRRRGLPPPRPSGSCSRSRRMPTMPWQATTTTVARRWQDCRIPTDSTRAERSSPACVPAVSRAMYGPVRCGSPAE